MAVLCVLLLVSSSYAGIKSVKIPLDYSWNYEGDDGYLWYDRNLTVDSGDLTLGVESTSGWLYGFIINNDPDFIGWSTITWSDSPYEGEVNVMAWATTGIKDASPTDPSPLNVSNVGINAEPGEWLEKGDTVPYSGGLPADCRVLNLQAYLSLMGGPEPSSAGGGNDIKPMADLSNPRLHSITVYYNTSGGSDTYNDPNPFTPGGGSTTNIMYSVDNAGSKVEIKIFTLSGKLVWEKTIFNVSAGGQSTGWDGISNLNQEVANGVYLCVIIITDPSGNQTINKCKIGIK